MSDADDRRRREDAVQLVRGVLTRAAGKRSGWRDAWLEPPVELVVGCVLLVLSGIYWWTSALQGWQDVLATVTAVLGPWFVYRAWKRH